MASRVQEIPGEPLRVSARRSRADEWALVLVAEGFAPTIWGVDAGFAVGVVPEHAERALAVLDAYDRENRQPPRPPEAPPLDTSHGPLRAAIAVFGALLCFFAITGPRSEAVDWFVRGSADAERILAGEWWRTVTALTLHADFAHVLANTLTGAFFLTAVCRVLGPGLGCALVLLAGATGNALNAVVHEELHRSIGASTAVFGAVGLLGGLGVGRLRRGGARGQRAWVSVAAALGLLAMLGTAGERTDLWAHGLGLAVGGVLGVPLGFVARPRPSSATQWILGGAALATVLGCWSLALA